ncbi:Rap1a/Tai family immunity protein [Burkholderia sp. BCC0097]|uniref:Rap1a/Tai family immunity protein n=1 Tax=Burkholderia sp. BCC0097 TaxID=2676289 RepID=UPI00158EE0CF|nr:Rap1a/Tai family immunity protein [Burkholderia sp. BCC0097]
MTHLNLPPASFLCRAVLVAGFLFLPLSAKAAAMTGRQLESWINSNDGALRLAASMYVMGVVDDDAVLQASEMQGLTERSSAVHMCAADKANATKLRQIVGMALHRDRQLGAQPAVIVIRKAVAQAYPCH